MLVPSMSTLAVTAGKAPLVRWIVPATLKSIVWLPWAASAVVIAWRSEPGPLSFRFVTAIALRTDRSSSC